MVVFSEEFDVATHVVAARAEVGAIASWVILGLLVKIYAA